VTTTSIAEEPADSEAVRWCFARYYEELDRRFERGFDVAAALPLGVDDLTPPRGLVLVARRDGRPVGCGALKLADPRIAEIKRMWVSPEVRGQGLGGRMLAALEARALAAGRSLARLETNRSLLEAIAMYRRHGYREVAAFNEEVHGDHWFEKDLVASKSGGADSTEATAP
jgi:ribosomal protein S18 acetylase RimI-like enzyme